eukprot:3045764-Prymnesium_polylepis.2
MRTTAPASHGNGLGVHQRNRPGRLAPAQRAAQGWPGVRSKAWLDALPPASASMTSSREFAEESDDWR